MTNAWHDNVIYGNLKQTKFFIVLSSDQVTSPDRSRGLCLQIKHNQGNSRLHNLCFFTTRLSMIPRSSQGPRPRSEVQQAEQQLLERPTAWAGCHTQDHDPVTSKIHFLMSASLVMLCWAVGQWEITLVQSSCQDQPLILAEVS